MLSVRSLLLPALFVTFKFHRVLYVFVAIVMFWCFLSLGQFVSDTHYMITLNF